MSFIGADQDWEDEIKKLRADLATERAIVKKWNCEMSKALAGSEYINEPAAYVRAFQKKSDTIKEQAIEIRAERTARESLAKERAEAKPIGWLHKVIVDKRVTGGTREGQIEVGGVWGTPSDHLYFTPERCEGRYFWWEAPVYLHPAHNARLTAPLERRVGELERALKAGAHGIRQWTTGIGRCERVTGDYHIKAAEQLDQLADRFEALASTPREGQREPQKQMRAETLWHSCVVPGYEERINADGHLETRPILRPADPPTDREQDDEPLDTPEFTAALEADYAKWLAGRAARREQVRREAFQDRVNDEISAELRRLADLGGSGNG